MILAQVTPLQVLVPSPDKVGGLGGAVQIPSPVKINKINEIQCTMTTKQTGTHRLGRRPVIQGPRLKLGNWGWVEKLATRVEGEGGENKLKAAKDFLNIGTWNVWTFRSPGKLELLRKEITQYECDILGLAEMRWTGVGELNGGEVIWSGEEKDHMRGVGFLLRKRAKDTLQGVYPCKLSYHSGQVQWSTSEHCSDSGLCTNFRQYRGRGQNILLAAGVHHRGVAKEGCENYDRRLECKGWNR